MMTQHNDPRTADLDTPEANKLSTRLAFENAYRLKKKVLICEIERSLGFSLRDAAPNLSGI